MVGPRIVAYWGDPLLVERALGRALAGWGPCRRVVLFGDETCLGRLLAEVESRDLFGEGRAIVVRRAEPLVGEERLARALARGVPDDLGIAFLGEDLKGPVVETAHEAKFLPTPTGRALRTLAGELLSEAGIPAPASVVDLLVETTGGDPLRLAQEVRKLALWERLPTRWPQLLFSSLGPPYAYLDAVGMREIPTALGELRRLLRTGANPTALFFAVVGHVRALLAALAASAAGRVPPGPPWLVQKRLAQARRWGEGGLVGLLASLQALDLRVKTGQLSPEAALYRFTLGLPQPGPG